MAGDFTLIEKDVVESVTDVQASCQIGCYSERNVSSFLVWDFSELFTVIFEDLSGEYFSSDLK